MEACAGGGRATCGVRLRGHPTDHRFRSLAPGVAPALPALARAASFGMLAGFVFSPATRMVAVPGRMSFALSTAQTLGSHKRAKP